MIIEIKNLLELKKALWKSDADALVIFDLDDVLVLAQDALFHPFNRQAKLKKECFDKMHQHLPLNQGRSSGFFQLLSSVFLNGKRGLVHPAMPKLIAELHKKGIKTLGLTNTEVGRFGKIEKMEDWKLSELKRWGINLGEYFSNRTENIVLDTAKTITPIFKDGVIFTDNSSKSETLMTFFDRVGFLPQTIIFIDDLMENLEGVQEACEKKSIPFIGIHFLIAHLQSCTLNLQIASKQIEHLISEKIWINDDQIV